MLTSHLNGERATDLHPWSSADLNHSQLLTFQDLEGIKSDLSRKMSEMESGVKLRAVEQEKKAAGDVRQLQKESQAVRKDKEDLSR